MIWPWPRNRRQQRKQLVSGNELPDFPKSDQDAAARFDATKSADPFPGVPPALLNSADLLDYISATGMIYPFDVDPEEREKFLKPASCAIPVGGEWLYWPPTTESAGPEAWSEILGPGEDLWLKPNSIVYVTLAPYFRIPDYIAARYNLRIKHIYRGILVGTGPLVDPGFQGYLSVPLHNLTANEYLIKGGEPLVWMEFTKLSPNEKWATAPDSPPARRGRYVDFPDYKLERQSVRNYVQHAHKGPIRSSIPEQTERARKAADNAESQAEKFRNRSWLTGFAVFVAILALTYQGLDFVNGATEDEDALRENVRELREDLSNQREAFRRCAVSGAVVLSARCVRSGLRASTP
jgi:deoxycytidine triphosphate deaminase